MIWSYIFLYGCRLLYMGTGRPAALIRCMADAPRNLLSICKQLTKRTTGVKRREVPHETITNIQVFFWPVRVWLNNITRFIFSCCLCYLLFSYTCIQLNSNLWVSIGSRGLEHLVTFYWWHVLDITIPLHLSHLSLQKLVSFINNMFCELWRSFNSWRQKTWIRKC